MGFGLFSEWWETARLVYRMLRLCGRHDGFFILAYFSCPSWILWVLRVCFERRSSPRLPMSDRLRHVLVALGPSFIKLGQALSVRPDVVGEEISRALEPLQDRLPPEPDGRRLAELSLGRELSEMFRKFEEEPVAAASIGQVHKAQRHDGRWVGVKLLRWGIRERMALDYRVLRRLAKMRESGLRFRRPLLEVVEYWWTWTRRELDMSQEAASLTELSRNMQNEEGIEFPRVHWDLTTRDALVIDWVEGFRITDQESLSKHRIESQEILTRAVQLFFLQLFRDGYFHADIHPGNFFIREDGVMIPVDFGIMGRLSFGLRRFLAETLVGFLTGDYGMVARAHADAGYIADDEIVRAEFASACAAIGEPLFGVEAVEGENNAGAPSLASLVLSLTNLAENFDMRFRTQLLLIHKTMLQAEGLGRMIDPSLNIWKTVEPMARDYMEEMSHPAERLRWQVEEVASVGMRLVKGLVERESSSKDSSLSVRETHKMSSNSFVKGGVTGGVIVGMIGGVIGGLVVWILSSMG